MLSRSVILWNKLFFSTLGSVDDFAFAGSPVAVLVCASAWVDPMGGGCETGACPGPTSAVLSGPLPGSLFAGRSAGGIAEAGAAAPATGTSSRGGTTVGPSSDVRQA